MLIGLFKPSKGTAYVKGFNLEDDMGDIRKFMGICPQHDLLWENMSGEEHLRFYGRLKHLSGKQLDNEVDSVLKKVNLWDARKKWSKKYSGGMKRRLSVAISIIGHPKIIYLDEPSTGLDPKSRQDLWKVINEAKQTATIVLTTHSMEEADAICDRLMIMSDGEIECIGVSADLKHRFGSGFKLSMQVSKGNSAEPAHNFVNKLMPGITLINELAGTRNYQVPKDSVTLANVFESMESEKEKLNITDWAITNTTLEEVFMRVSMNQHKSKEEQQSHKEEKQPILSAEMELP